MTKKQHHVNSAKSEKNSKKEKIELILSVVANANLNFDRMNVSFFRISFYFFIIIFDWKIVYKENFSFQPSLIGFNFTSYSTKHFLSALKLNNSFACISSLRHQEHFSEQWTQLTSLLFQISFFVVLLIIWSCSAFVLRRWALFV